MGTPTTTMAAISSRHFKVRYQGHLLNTVVTGWHSILDLRAHCGQLVGLPAYHIQIFVCGYGDGRQGKIECVHMNKDQATLDNDQYKHVEEIVVVPCDVSLPHCFMAPLVSGKLPVYCILTDAISTVKELTMNVRGLTGVNEMRLVGHGNPNGLGEMDGKDLDQDLLLVQYNLQPGQVFLYIDLIGDSQL